jgi:hypothetical protein
MANTSFPWVEIRLIGLLHFFMLSIWKKIIRILWEFGSKRKEQWFVRNMGIKAREFFGN